MAAASSSTGSAVVALSNDLAGAVERAGASVVAIHARQRIPSSGIIWRDGVVVAANHTVKREDDITIAFADGRSARATLAGRDASTDLAVLRLAERGGTAATLGDSGSLRVGHMVLAVGRAGEGGPSASLGVVSMIGPEWRTYRGGRIDHFIRLDVAIYDGFSGGPLVDVAGRVVGVNTSGLARGAALAIPVSTVERVLEQLLATGRVSRGYLGLGMQPVRLPDALVETLGLDGDTGLIILSVEPSGPGAAAGLFIGDVLVAIDGQAVSDTHEMLALLGAESVGKRVTARVVRGGTTKDVAITVAERPRGGDAR